MRKEREREGMKRTQCCIKLFPNRRGVDKKSLSKPEQALHRDGESGEMREKKAEGDRGRETEKKRGERQAEDKL